MYKRWRSKYKAAELGPNYTIKEKLYETKEIYIVEGDYVE